MSKKTSARANRRGMLRTATERSIRLRMYNVGFGDCFLLRVPADDGERRILVDCGYHSQGKGKFTDAEIVNQIKSDLDGDPLDVVVATHRHQDHISGFGEQELWRDIPVEEVWLPFTVDPAAADADPALAAWNGLMATAGRLLDAGGKLAAAAAAALDARDQEERAAVEFMLWNARANAPAIENLLRLMRRADGRPATRRFLPGKGDRFPSSFTTPALPGAKVHVLGPPKDPAFRKARKVPAGWGLHAGTENAAAAVQDDHPFPADWRIPRNHLPGRLPFLSSSLNSIRLFNDDVLAAARALDGFLNGESLVLVLEIGSARLLLPGDAEVGTWTTILGNPEALALAASATFLKIGHHGSHNATPLVFIDEHLALNTPAVISTQEGPGRYRNGIPLDRLLERLSARKMPLARSDKPPATRQGIFRPDSDQRWIDCAIPC